MLPLPDVYCKRGARRMMTPTTRSKHVTHVTIVRSIQESAAAVEAVMVELNWSLSAAEEAVMTESNMSLSAEEEVIPQIRDDV